MSYTPPIFNIDCNIWHDGVPITDPPDIFTQCQLYVNSRVSLNVNETDDEEWVPPIFLRVPFGTDVRRLDSVECVAGSGVWYHVRWVERVHLGFANQYVMALLSQGLSGPSGGGFLLLETGDFVQLESGEKVLLE